MFYETWKELEVNSPIAIGELSGFSIKLIDKNKEDEQ